MTKISANIVAHSKHAIFGMEAVSVQNTFPRIILAELNTHRMLSKNTASSRAIPYKRMVESVKENPFIPIAWQKLHPGMQGTEYHTDQQHINLFEAEYLRARDNNIRTVEILSSNIVIAKSLTDIEEITDSGVTKQITNRLIEPFMWITALVSGTEWENFFELRCPNYEHTGKFFPSKRDWLQYNFHGADRNGNKIYIPPVSTLDWLQINKGQAEIHMMALAEAIWDAQSESEPKILQPGEWHIPYDNKIVELLTRFSSDCHSTGGKWIMDKVKVSTAMGARTSYTVVGDEKDISYEKLIGIHDRMAVAKPFHASPFEHPMRAMTESEFFGYAKVYKAKSDNISEKLLNEEKQGITLINRLATSAIVTEYGWCRNVRGFIQYRHILENESMV